MKVIDLFSGPGGLGEGFSSLNDGSSFDIAVSAEMEASAHKTLTLRAFFRLAQRMGDKPALDSYYAFCNFEDAPHPSSVHLKLWNLAADEARQLELGNTASDDVLNQIIKSKKLGGDDIVLIGGPPCQAYSHAGRARNKGKTDYVAAKDHRHYLYREYLKVLAKTKPAVFVMENVKGILSSSPGGTPIFHEILKDLTDPVRAIENKDGPIYAIHSLTTSTCFEKGMSPDEIDPRDFIIQAEHYGIPQERHRVILLGVRKDRKFAVTELQKSPPISVRTAIGRLPRLRSQLSPLRDDSASNWVNAVASNGRRLGKDALKAGMNALGHRLYAVSGNLDARLDNGALRVPVTKKTTDERKPSAFMSSIGDPNLSVWLNHQARSHMPSDLGRYLYASSFCEVYQRRLRGHTDFALPGLAPDHANWESGDFKDRFKVQSYEGPSSTITSHISKDGHSFIHPDPLQCRALTVREAARLQTFPDNYFFQGNRTQQFHQVGNAVPPLLAKQIAEIVLKIVS